MSFKAIFVLTLITFQFLSVGCEKAHHKPALIEQKSNPNQFNNQPEQNSKSINPVILLIVKDKDRKRLYVDGKETKTRDLLQTLGNPFIEKGVETPLLILFDGSVDLDYIDNMFGIANKVGFTKIKYYIMSSDRNTMKEVTIDKPAVYIPKEYVHRLTKPS